MTIAKYRAQAQRVEEELHQLQAGQQVLNVQSVATQSAPRGPKPAAAAAQTLGAAPAAHSNLDTKMGEELSAAVQVQQQHAAQPQQQAASRDGMWL